MKRRSFLARLLGLGVAPVIAPSMAEATEKVFEAVDIIVRPPMAPKAGLTTINITGELFTSKQIRELIDKLNAECRDGGFLLVRSL